MSTPHTATTRGGTSATPTPANNSTGRDNDNNTGIPNFGNEGSGHVPMDKPVSSEGEFLSLSQQKGIAEGNYQDRMGRETRGSVRQGTCETEDHSFMERRPGEAESLAGRARGAVKDMFG